MYHCAPGVIKKYFNDWKCTIRLKSGVIKKKIKLLFSIFMYKYVLQFKILCLEILLLQGF